MHQDRLSVLWLVLITGILFLIPLASADFLEDMMNQKIIGTVDELPFSRPNPEMNWQENGNIKGWVDVIGFKNLTKVDGVFYTYGNVTDITIYRGESIGIQDGKQDDISNSFSFSQSGDKLTVSMTVVLTWHKVKCDKQGCYISERFTDTAVFQDTDIIPQQFVMPGNQSVIEKHYIGKQYQPNILTFDVAPVITEIHTTTANASMTHYLQIGIVNYTDKNIPFVELSPINQWEYMGANNTISSFINEMVSDENFTSVSFLTPYGWVGANITEVYPETTHIHWEVFGILFVVGTLLYGIYRMAVRAQTS